MSSEKKTVSLTIEGKTLTARPGKSLLEIIRQQGHRVPSLCHHPLLSPYGACRLCLVEVQKGKKKILTTSCNYPVQEGLEVFLDTDRVRHHRKLVLELLWAMAPKSEAIGRLCAEYGVQQIRFQKRVPDNHCILCGLCVRVCKEVAQAESLTFEGRGKERELCRKPFGDFPESCIGCGACEKLCPTGAIFMEGTAIARLRQKPSGLRPCRYALMGLTPGAICENDYACANCEIDQRMVDRSKGHHPIFLARKRIFSEDKK